MKKLFSIITTVALVAGLLPVVNTNAAYSDELMGAYEYAYGMGITTMSSIDQADMYGTLTRVALAKMISNYVLELGLQTPDTSKECNFSDVSETLDAQYANGVTNACQLGLMGVGITEFRPFDVVTRAEFGTVLSRALWGDANNGGDPYYTYHLNSLLDAGVMTKIDTPSMTEVRGYVMLMMQRADETGANTPAICQTPENILACSLELDSCPVECKETVVTNPGLATVSLVGSAVTHKVPQNVKSYKVGTIKLTAGENETTVSSLVVTRSNLGTPTAVTSMQLAFAKDGTAASIASTAMSNTTQSKTLRLSPSLVLKAGESVELDLLITLNDGVNQNSIHDFAVTAVNVVDGTANGTPVMVGTLETTSYSAGTVTLDGFVGGIIVVGKTDQVVANVDLRANRDAIVKGFTITKDAGADFNDAVADVKAYYNGSVVGNVIVDAEKITVSNLNIEKANGETANIELKGRGTYIGNDSVITGSITTDDQFVVEKSSGFPMSATTGKQTTFQLSNIDITLQKATTGSTTVVPGASSVKLFEAVISSSAEFDVSSWTVSHTGAGAISGAFVDNIVTVYVNGVDYEMTDGGFTKSLSADRFRVGPSDTITVKVVGNLLSTATTGVDYKFTFAINQVKNISNGQTVTFSPSRSVQGDTVTVGNGGYTISKPTTIPLNKTVMEGDTVDVAYFNMRANSENQVLKNIGITSNTGFSRYASKVALMQGTTELKSFTAENDLSGTTLNFGGDVLTGGSLSQTLTKDTTTPFTVKVTLKAGEVENLGNSVNIDVGTGYVVRSVSQTTRTATTSTAVVGKAYQISSNLPTIAIPSQVDKNTVVSFMGISNYDVQILSGDIEFTRNLVNGSYVQWAGYAQVLDAIGGSAAGSTGTVPGLATLTFTNLMLDSSEAQRVLELVDPSNTVTDADYTVTIKNVSFKYIDKNDPSRESAVITESYNVAR